MTPACASLSALLKGIILKGINSSKICCTFMCILFCAGIDFVDRLRKVYMREVLKHAFAYDQSGHPEAL